MGKSRRFQRKSLTVDFPIPALQIIAVIHVEQGDMIFNDYLQCCQYRKIVGSERSVLLDPNDHPAFSTSETFNSAELLDMKGWAHAQVDVVDNLMYEHFGSEPPQRLISNSKESWMPDSYF